MSVARWLAEAVASTLPDWAPSVAAWPSYSLLSMHIRVIRGSKSKLLRYSKPKLCHIFRHFFKGSDDIIQIDFRHPRPHEFVRKQFLEMHPLRHRAEAFFVAYCSFIFRAIKRAACCAFLVKRLEIKWPHITAANQGSVFAQDG